MLRIRAVLAAHVAALVDRDAQAAVEHLDHSRGDPHIDLGASERVPNRVEEVMDLDVIIEGHPRAPPFRELPILSRQRVECGALDLLEQLAPAQAEMSHGTLVEALHHSAMAWLHSASEKKVDWRIVRGCMFQQI